MCPGEKMSDDEVDSLIMGCEDAQGQVNYEGQFHYPIGPILPYCGKRKQVICHLNLLNVFIFSLVSRQLPTRTIPHHVDIGPDEWFYSFLMVLVGSWGVVLGIVVLVGNSWALFLSGWELYPMGVGLEPFYLVCSSSFPNFRHNHSSWYW